MLRSFFIFLLLFASLVSSGQNDSLVKKLSHTVCDCFDEVRTTASFNEETFADCVANAMDESSDLIMQECIKVYGDTSEESAYKLGRKLFESIKVELVYDCYDYFVYMDSLRYDALKGLNEDSLKRELKWFNSKSKAPDSSTFYADRGILKLQLRDTSGAYYDLYKAVRLNEENISARFFRGWILEMRKEYASAITDFQYVAEVTGDSNYSMIVAILERKRKMTGEIKK